MARSLDQEEWRTEASLAESYGSEGILSSDLVYRRLRAPRADRCLLLEPSWAELVESVAANTALLQSRDFEMSGGSFQELRRHVRTRLLRQAREYTRVYVDLPDMNLSPEQPFVLSGHQPTLFHPGVWAKNFAMDRLAQAVDGQAIQVVIDNDAMHHHAVVCPSGTIKRPTRTSVPFDRYQAPIPYEQRYVLDHELFATFADRIRQQMQPFCEQPLVREIWPDAIRGVERGLPIGAAIAQARHILERKWGLRTIEIPLSQVCEYPEFYAFAISLFARADQLQASYNTRLQEYRDVHRLKNHAQPLPNLKCRHDWFEMPFWLWTNASPQRQALWLRLHGGDLELTNETGHVWSIRNPTLDPDAAALQLNEHCRNGLRLRPRALATTMFLRLMCADAFLHGIGGAKYDQVTDLIIHDLFGLPAPLFGVLSWTVWMPSPLDVVEPREIIHRQQKIREMHFHPERFLDPEILAQDQVSRKVKSKKKLLGEKPPRGSAGSWQRALERVNAELREFLLEKTASEKKILLERSGQAKMSEMFMSREWSFCLFEEPFLRELLLDLPYTHA